MQPKVLVLKTGYLSESPECFKKMQVPKCHARDSDLIG